MRRTPPSTFSHNPSCMPALHQRKSSSPSCPLTFLAHAMNRLQIIDGYEPETYLPESPLEPPMRSLTSEQHPEPVPTEPFGIPNLLTGLSAALCAEVRRLTFLPFSRICFENATDIFKSRLTEQTFPPNAYCCLAPSQVVRLASTTLPRPSHRAPSILPLSKHCALSRSRLSGSSCNGTLLLVQNQPNGHGSNAQRRSATSGSERKTTICTCKIWIFSRLQCIYTLTERLDTLLD